VAANRKSRDSARKTRRGTGGDEAAPRPAPRSTLGAALALLARRDYTRYELQHKLFDRGYEDEDIERVTDELIARGLLDDARVAAAHVRTASSVKGRGRVRIARELAARGVERDVIDAALAGLTEDDQAAAIARVLNRRRAPGRLSLADRQKLYRQLLRRGFPSSAIGRWLGAVQRDDPDDA
jgi:regulatory protein